MSLKKINKKKIIPYGVPINSGSPDSILASLLRKIYYDVNIDIAKFYILVSRYISKFSKSTSPKIISSEKGNIKKELTAETISWNVFVSKGLAIINAKKIKIKLEITHSNNLITEHEKEFELNYDNSNTNVEDDNDGG